MNKEKDKLRNKVLELVEREDFEKYLKLEIDKLLDSGFINCSDDKDGFLMAKIVLYCALKREAEQYKPFDSSLTRKYKELIKDYEN